MVHAPPARIDIDGYNLALEAGTGVATYARNLSHALAAMGCASDVIYGQRIRRGADPLLREIHFFDPLLPPRRSWVRRLGQGKQVIAGLGGLDGFEVPISGRVIADTFADRLPAHRRMLNARNLFAVARDFFAWTGRRLELRVPDPPQIMHWTYPLPIRLKGALNIYTLHDLVPLRLPYTTLDVKSRYLKLVRLLAREADHIVTVSETSRRDIIDLLGIDEGRVTNTYQAVTLPPETARPGHTPFAAALGLKPKDYFLFFGAVEPKKNIERMIQAYLASGAKAKLLIVGKPAWKSGPQLSLLETLPEASHGVIHLNYLPYALLVGLLRDCKAVLFPSLYEGFGLPVLEGFLAAVPVLTSTTPALAEIAEGAALMVSPYDIGQMAAGILALDSHPELCADLVARGRQRAAFFSAEAYRERLRGLYGRLGADV